MTFSSLLEGLFYKVRYTMSNPLGNKFSLSPISRVVRLSFEFNSLCPTYDILVYLTIFHYGLQTQPSIEMNESKVRGGGVKI